MIRWHAKTQTPVVIRLAHDFGFPSIIRRKPITKHGEKDISSKDEHRERHTHRQTHTHKRARTHTDTQTHTRARIQTHTPYHTCISWSSVRASEVSACSTSRPPDMGSSGVMTSLRAREDSLLVITATNPSLLTAIPYRRMEEEDTRRHPAIHSVFKCFAAGEQKGGGGYDIQRRNFVAIIAFIHL